MKFECLLIDLNGTILDFHKVERMVLKNTMRHSDVEPTTETLGLYQQINDEL